MSSPKVTVLMPVYNGERYLREAIESILWQTFTDFEFLIINDGSDDGSIDIINTFKDKRIRLIHNESNIGLVDTLNKGIELSSGEFIARMDCDDISLPQRLQKQFNFMSAHPRVAVCGTAIKFIGEKWEAKRYQYDDCRIRAWMLFESAFAHPTVFLRREVFIKEGLRYSDLFRHSEDYDLWTRIPRHYQLANMEQKLLCYRVHGEQVSNEKAGEQVASSNRIRKRLVDALDLPLNDQELKDFYLIARRLPTPSMCFIHNAEQLLLKLIVCIDRKSITTKSAYFEAVGHYWWETCFNSSGLGFTALRCFLLSPLAKYANISLYYQMIFAVKCLLKLNRKEKANILGII